MVSPRLQLTPEELAKIDRLTEAGEDDMRRTIAVKKLTGQPLDFGEVLKSSLLAIHEEAQKPINHLKP